MCIGANCVPGTRMYLRKQQQQQQSTCPPVPTSSAITQLMGLLWIFCHLIFSSTYCHCNLWFLLLHYTSVNTSYILRNLFCENVFFNNLLILVFLQHGDGWRCWVGECNAEHHPLPSYRCCKYNFLLLKIDCVLFSLKCNIFNVLCVTTTTTSTTIIFLSSWTGVVYGEGKRFLRIGFRTGAQFCWIVRWNDLQDWS